MRAKHIIGDFEGFFDPQIILSAAKGNFGVKKVEAPAKKPREFADYGESEVSRKNKKGGCYHPR
jgi:hypothetical protein